VGAHAERLAEQGSSRWCFGNSPKAMAFWGGRKPMLGTNPLAFAVVRCRMARRAPPWSSTSRLSVAARGKIVAAQKAGKRDSSRLGGGRGRPADDRSEGRARRHAAPIGGAKGGALALMVEILAAAVTGSAFGWEASSFFDADGGPPDMGHLFIAIDPPACPAAASTRA
jgi:(2R)-3-sulfolactate dehydrogenase (NADP+)